MGNRPREISEKTLRLRAVARTDDGFFSTFVLRKISRVFTSALVETGIRPNTVTVTSIVFGLLSAYVAAQGKYLVAAIAFIFSLILDCVDGEVARYKNQFTQLGAWLDALADRVKEFAYIGALIYSTNESRTWWLGIALVVLQTIRHLSDYNFVRMQKSYEEISQQPNRAGFRYWIKRILNYPIGERWLLLAVLPLLMPVLDALRLILFFGILSFIYALLARARRISRWPSKEVDSQFILLQRDTLLPFKLSASRISWTYPSLLRGFEFFVLISIPFNISSGIQFLLISAVALWHYTNLYDALQSRDPYLGGAGLRIAGRVLLCLISFALGFDKFFVMALSIYLFGLILVRGGHNVRRGGA
jgi:phosphatidylglycerophosphate synthase